MHPVLVHRPVSLLHPSFGPYLTATPLRFASLHLHQVGTGLSPVAAEHARRTSGTARPKLCRQAVETISFLAAGSGSRSLHSARSLRSRREDKGSVRVE